MRFTPFSSPDGDAFFAISTPVKMRVKFLRLATMNACARQWLAPLVCALALAASAAASQAADSSGYGDRVRARLAQLLDGRALNEVEGCDEATLCAALVAQLRAGNFTVVEPVERSDLPDMLSYLRVRKKCRGLDIAHLTAAHRRLVATRNFSAWKLDLPRKLTGGSDVMIFRAQHYVAADAKGTALAGDGEAALSGMYVAVGFPSCRTLTIADAPEGDWFAKHNPVGEDDYLSEILKLGDRFFVLNLDPVAGPELARESWGYRLELRDLGSFAAERNERRRVYAFSTPPSREN